MNIRLFWNNLPRIVLRPFYFSFFFFNFFFYLRFFFFFFFFFFFGDNHSSTLNSRTKRRERNSDRNDTVLIFFLFSSLNGIWFLAMQFHVGSCFFRLDVNTTLRALTDCNRNFYFFSSWVIFHGYVYDVMNYWRQLEEINWKCSILWSIWNIMEYFYSHEINVSDWFIIAGYTDDI